MFHPHCMQHVIIINIAIVCNDWYVSWWSLCLHENQYHSYPIHVGKAILKRYVIDRYVSHSCWWYIDMWFISHSYSNPMISNSYHSSHSYQVYPLYKWWLTHYIYISILSILYRIQQYTSPYFFIHMSWLIPLSISPLALINMLSMVIPLKKSIVQGDAPRWLWTSSALTWRCSTSVVQLPWVPSPPSCRSAASDIGPGTTNGGRVVLNSITTL